MQEKTRLTMSYYQAPGEVPRLGRTFGDLIRQAAREVPDKTAIIYGERRITFAELDRLTDNVALGLLHLGFTKGDRLGLCAPDWPEYSIYYYACAKIGVLTSPISPRYREKEFRNILGHSGAKGVLIPASWNQFDFTAMLAGLRPELPELETVLVLGDSPAVGRDGFVSAEWVISTDWIGPYGPDYLDRVYYKQYPVEADDLLEVFYTSGTTGVPKGAVHTHNTRIAVAMLNNERWRATPDDIMISMSPLCHSIGSNHAQNGAIVGRFTVVYLGEWSPERCLQEIERLGATILIGVPSMVIALRNHPDFRKYNVSTVRGIWLAGAPLPVTVAQQVSEEFGCKVISTYGTTECGGNHCTDLDDPIEVSSTTVGTPIRGSETKIVDTSGHIVPVGTPGEVCTRGPTRFLGYYKNPEATAAAIDQAGWFHSGDLGIMDEHGYIRIIGRIKDMIIRGGLNIYATEIEELLYSHPAVKEAYLVGYPDDYLGERTCAFIVPREPGTVLSRDDLVAFLENKVARYKIPDRVEMITEVPRTHSGKVQKFKLREQLLEKLKAGQAG